MTALEPIETQAPVREAPMAPPIGMAGMADLAAKTEKRDTDDEDRWAALPCTD